MSKIKLKSKFGNYFLADEKDVGMHLKNGAKKVETKKKEKTLTSTETGKLTKKTSA